MSDRKSRMFSAGEEPMKRTIVGGRPPSRGGDMSGIPRGIEVMLRKAKVDDAFREAFLADPMAAAKTIDLDLAETERAILSAVPAATLADMVDRIEVLEEHRSVFKGRTAAAMLSLVAATFAVGCSDPMIAPGGCVVRDDPVIEDEPAVGTSENTTHRVPFVVGADAWEDTESAAPVDPDEPETPEEPR